jgi:class 3 adenylate cyclase/tetratricopeptide (TPR) repeat protein
MIGKTLTILFADVKGYTSRTGKHTRQEHEQFIIELQSFIKTQAEQNNGNFVKSMGDGFMLTFESPTNAVACGLSIQKHVTRQDSTLKKHAHLSFRIGISTGEVMVDDTGDAYGEAVNIAARIEKSAQVGEVYISEATYLSMNKSEFNGVNLGAQRFKNVSHPVNVYRAFEGSADLIRNLQRPIQKQHFYSASKILAVLVIVIAGLFLIRSIGLKQNRHPENDIHVQLEQLLEGKEFNQVIKTVHQTLQQQPHRGDLYIFAGKAAFMLKQYKKAGNYLQKAIEHDPDNPEPHYILSELYANLRKYDQAISALADYLSKDIDTVDRQMAINRMKELEQFKKQLFSSSFDQHDNQNLYILSVAQPQDKQPAQDRSDILQTVYFSSENDTVDAAAFEQEHRQPHIGEQNDDEALQSIKNRVLPFIKQGDFPPARQILEQAEQKLAQNIRFLIFAGRMYSNMSDYGKAEEMFNKAKDAAPENPVSYLELSRIYEQAEEYQASIDMLEEFIIREKDDMRRQKAKKRLDFLKTRI